MRFQDLKIDEAILKAIREIGYDQPTPIQEKAIPIVLEGHDLLGCAQTGTGKTAAFSIPMLQRMGRPQEGEARPVRGLILTPTRELALQIYENLCQYGRYLGRISAVIFGGVSQNPQVEAIQNGADILVATPGRLWDLMGQKLVDISTVECFVLDEADRMLDMGFINDVKRILKFLPKKRQTLLFSATMPEEIADLANNMLHKPRHVSIVPAATPVELIEQGVYFTDKKAACYALLLKSAPAPAPSPPSTNTVEHAAGSRALFEHSAQQVTLGLFVGEVYALLDQLDRGCRRNDGYMARLVQHVVCQIGNLLGHGGREQQSLTLLGQELQNALDIVDKAHVQHTVSLVQNKALNRADVDQLLTHQIPQTARGCDQNVGAVLDGFDLRILGHTAKDDRRNTAEIAAILAQILVNL